MFLLSEEKKKSSTLYSSLISSVYPSLSSFPISRTRKGIGVQLALIPDGRRSFQEQISIMTNISK